MLNLTYAIIDFYTKLKREKSRFHHDKISTTTDIICQAIQLHYLDVIQYIIDDRVLSIILLTPDDFNRFFFTGVMANALPILTYLMNKVI